MDLRVEKIFHDEMKDDKSFKSEIFNILKEQFGKLSSGLLLLSFIMKPVWLETMTFLDFVVLFQHRFQH